jgi:gluconokinase
LILALDIGTSSVRAILFDRLGRAVRGFEARRAYELRTTADGASEIDPEALLEIVWHCVDDVVAGAVPLPGRIGGVATCTQVGNVLGVDQSAGATTPMITYADTRAACEVEALRAELDEEAVHDRTGCLFHASYLPARLRWLAATQPELLGRSDRWISIGEHMERRLFGDTAVSYSVASWTGLLDRRRKEWDRDLLVALGLKTEQLSPLTDVGAPRRGLRAPFAGRWPQLADVPWFPAVGDGAAANIGTGCVSPHQVALTVGTSAALRVVMPDPVERVPWGLWCYRVDGERSLPGGALSEGGNIFAWARSTLRLPDMGDLESALAVMEPDGHGLTVLPFLAGERSPGWAGNARAAIHGISLATTPLEIVRAGLEAVAFRIGMVFDLLRPLLPDGSRIIAGGGAMNGSPAWLQIIADVLARPVAVSQVGEASARGAALLALEAMGILKDLMDANPPVDSVVEPDAGRHARYREARERQQGFYDTLVCRGREGNGNQEVAAKHGR